MTMWTPEKIKKLRASYGETQVVFASRFPITVVTLANWEQGRHEAPAAMQTLLDYFRRDLEEGRVRELQTA